MIGATPLLKCSGLLDVTLGHCVYRKPTHTNQYLNQGRPDHPAKKKVVLSTLVNRDLLVSDKWSLETEVRHLELVVQQNVLLPGGYQDRGLYQSKKESTQWEESKGTVVVPY